MKKAWSVFLLAALFAISNAGEANAQLTGTEKEIVPSRGYRGLEIKTSPELQEMLAVIVREMITSHKGNKLSEDELAVTVIDLRDPSNAISASFRGNERIYPASVVKMFYMAALHQQIQDGKITLTNELERGLKDMIVDSSNEATQYIVDVLTDTSSGGELPQKDFEIWSKRRNRMNRFFVSQGYSNINVNQKTHCEDAYGVEQQFRSYKGENRNMLTTDATARLIAEIALGRSVSAERSKMMMELLKRDPFADKPNSQAIDFVGKALKDHDLRGAKLYSKAGWTSRSRHDAAYVETSTGSKFAIAIFTEKHSNEKEIIPALAARIMDGLEKLGK